MDFGYEIPGKARYRANFFGVVRSDIDYHKSYTLRFVNKGVGLDLRPKN